MCFFNVIVISNDCLLFLQALNRKITSISIVMENFFDLHSRKVFLIFKSAIQ